MRLGGLIAAVALLVCGPALAGPVAEPLDDHTVLIPGSFESGRQPDGNSVLIQGTDGVLVFDTGRHAAVSDAIIAVAKASAKPVTIIANSHWHLDHVSGNPRVKAAYPGAKTYASNAIDGALTGFLKSSAEQGRAALAEGKLPTTIAEDVTHDLATIDAGDKLRPDVVVTRDGKLPFKGRRIEAHLAHKAATAGDLWLYDVESKRVLAGDLVTLPAPFLDTACPQGWLDALGLIAAKRFTNLVPGHGRVMSAMNFASYRTALSDFVACASDAARPLASCAKGWTTGVATLLDDSNRKAAEPYAGYYAGLIRGGKLAQYCRS